MVSFLSCVKLPWLQTTPPVIVVCSSVPTTISTATIVHTSNGPAAASGQHDVGLLPSMILRNTRRSLVRFATVPQQKPQSQMPSQAYANMPWVLLRWIFFFRIEPLTISFMLVFVIVCAYAVHLQCGHSFHQWGSTDGICTTATLKSIGTLTDFLMLVSIMMYFLLSGSDVDTISTNGGATVGVLTTATLQSIPVVGICASWCWYLADTSSLSNSLMLLIQLSFSHSINMVGYIAFGGLSVTQSLHLSYLAGTGLLFQVCFQSVTWSTPNLWWALNQVILMCERVSGWWMYSCLVDGTFCCSVSYSP